MSKTPTQPVSPAAPSPVVPAPMIAPRVSLAARVESVPLTALGDKTHEQLFVYVTITETMPATSVVAFDPHNLVLRDVDGLPHDQQTYEGAHALKATSFLGPIGHTKGWLVFTVPTNATGGLSLAYIQTPPGTSQGPSAPTFAAIPLTVPPPDAARVYATRAADALRVYILDEALAAGDVAMDLDTLYNTGVGGGPVPGAARAELGRQHALLGGDRARFDAVSSADPRAQRLKATADAVFTAVENSLAAIGTVHTQAEWRAWRTTFGTDDRALGDLYQDWPGAQAQASS